MHHILLSRCRKSDAHRYHGVSGNCYDPQKPVPECTDYIVAWAIGGEVMKRTTCTYFWPLASYKSVSKGRQCNPLPTNLCNDFYDSLPKNPVSSRAVVSYRHAYMYDRYHLHLDRFYRENLTDVIIMVMVMQLVKTALQQTKSHLHMFLLFV